MSKYLKVEGYHHLVRESVSSGGIVNGNTNEYETYMKRIKNEKNKVMKLEMQ